MRAEGGCVLVGGDGFAFTLDCVISEFRAGWVEGKVLVIKVHVIVLLGSLHLTC